jgi:hypothetical protein
MRTLIVLAAVALSACAGGQPSPPFAVETDAPAGTPVAQPSVATPEPTPVPTLGPNEIPIGENVGITRDGLSWASLSVTEVQVDRSYLDPGPAVGGDRPRVGYVFVAAHVEIGALAEEDVPFTLEGFRASADGDPELEMTFSHLAPKPDLLAGTLEGRGDEATGWIIFEAPEEGRVRLWYDDGTMTSEPLPIVLRDA